MINKTPNNTLTALLKKIGSKTKQALKNTEICPMSALTASMIPMAIIVIIPATIQILTIIV